MDQEYVRARKIKIGGREFVLAFTLRALLMMQKRIEGFNLNNIEQHVSRLDEMATMLYVLAENGAKVGGKNLDVDQEWFESHTPVSIRKIMEIQFAINEAMADGMMMETEVDEERDKEIDVVLQEIQKKRQIESSPGEK